VRDRLAERLGGQAAVLDGMVLTAPVSGVVQDLQIAGPGQAVAAHEMLIKVVPLGDGLVVEARVANEDIGRLTAGMTAEVKVRAFDYLRFGSLEGTVRRVAADATADPGDAGKLAYAVTVVTARRPPWPPPGPARRRPRHGGRRRAEGRRADDPFLPHRPRAALRGGVQGGVSGGALANQSVRPAAPSPGVIELIHRRPTSMLAGRPRQPHLSDSARVLARRGRAKVVLHFVLPPLVTPLQDVRPVELRRVTQQRGRYPRLDAQGLGDVMAAHRLFDHLGEHLFGKLWHRCSDVDPGRVAEMEKEYRSKGSRKVALGRKAR